MNDALGPWLSAQGGEQRRLAGESLSRLPQERRRRFRRRMLIPWAIGAVALLAVVGFFVRVHARSISQAQVGECVAYIKSSDAYERVDCRSSEAQYVVRVVTGVPDVCVPMAGVARIAGDNRRAVCLAWREGNPDDSPQAVQVGQCLDVVGERGYRVDCGPGRRRVLAIEGPLAMKDQQNSELDGACADVDGLDRVWAFTVPRPDSYLNPTWDEIFCLGTPLG